MPLSLTELISPERALLFRITHRDNVAHLLRHGMQCRSSTVFDSNFVTIGNPDIIDRRKGWPVDVPPGGVLADYVPFYFTPRTPMLYNIVTGHNGLTLRMRSEIVVLVTSLDRLEELELPYVIADRNAVLVSATFTSGRAGLAGLRWDNWQGSDFKRDDGDPAKIEQYQAEALVHKSLPPSALRAIITYDSGTQATVAQAVSDAGLSTPVHVRSIWYP